MKFFGSLVLSSALLALATMSACSSAEKAGRNASLPNNEWVWLDVEATVSSVNLGSDCPDPIVAPAAAPTATAPTAPSSPTAPSAALAADQAQGAAESGASLAKRSGGISNERCAQPGCGGMMYCQQSSMQLAFAAKGPGRSTKVEIVKVELLDASGAVIGELASRRPQLWQDASGSYQPWDGLIMTVGDFKASYSLAAPDWSKVPGGRYGTAAGLSVRVTMALGERQVIQTATAVSVMVDPQVVT